MNNIYGGMLSRPTQSYTRQSGQASGLGQKQPQSCPTGYRYDTVQGKCVAINKVNSPTVGQQLGMPSNMTPGQPQQPATLAPTAPAGTATTGQKKSPNEIWADVVNNAINHLGGSIPGNSGVMVAQQGNYNPNIGKNLGINQDFMRLVNGR